MLAQILLIYLQRPESRIPTKIKKEEPEMKFKKFTALLLCLLTVLSLVACGGDKPTTGTTGKGTYKEEIVIALNGEFTTIDPQAGTQSVNQIVQDCTHDLLTDTDLNIMANAGELAEKWEMLALDHWRFTLKKGVKFHDGTILNVDDVKFTFDRAAENSVTKNYMSNIKEFIKVDDLTFELKLVSGNVDFNYSMAANSLAILSKEAFETMPEEKAAAIGTGAWKLEEYVPSDYVSLVRFDECTLYPVPNTKRLVFKMIPEATSRMIALENGEVDIALGIGTSDFGRLAENSKLEMISTAGRTQHYIGFNLKSPNKIITDKRFREAIACGIDKEELVIAAWDGYAQVSTGIMCRDMGFYSDIEGIPYDEAKAKKLFDECGATGKTFNLVCSNTAVREKLSTNLQAQLKKYDITLNVEILQSTAVTEKLKADPTTSGYEIVLSSWSPGMNADYMFRNTLNSKGGSNRVYLADAEVDDLMDRAINETDPAKRAQMYTDLQNLLVCDIIPWIPIAQPTVAMGVAKGVTGALLHPADVHQVRFAEKLVG